MCSGASQRRIGLELRNGPFWSLLDALGIIVVLDIPALELPFEDQRSSDQSRGVSGNNEAVPH